jgi:signal transduction histidine kinase
LLNQSTSSFVSHDLVKDSVFGKFAGPSGSFLSVPLLVRDQTIGRLNFYNHRPARFSLPKMFRKRDAELAVMLAQQAALLLDNCGLVDQLDSRNRQFQATLPTLQSAQNELIQKEQLSAIGEMASMVAHDMRSPLTTVLGYAGMIRDMELSEAEIEEFTTTIAEQVDQINQMAQNILDFSSGDSNLNKELIAPDVLIGELMRQLRIEFRQQPGLELSCGTICRQPLRIDLEKMMRCLLNLVRNAAEAVEGNGRVVVSCRSCEAGAELVVADNGPGIPEEIRGKLFQPFATYGKAKGTGLGLAIVRKIVQDHGGKIRLESEMGHGTTFIITLPVAETPAR